MLFPIICKRCQYHLGNAHMIMQSLRLYVAMDMDLAVDALGYLFESRECCRETLLTAKPQYMRDVRFVVDQTMLARGRIHNTQERPKYHGPGADNSDLNSDATLCEGHADERDFQEMERLAPDGRLPGGAFLPLASVTKADKAEPSSLYESKKREETSNMRDEGEGEDVERDAWQVVDTSEEEGDGDALGWQLPDPQ